MLAVLHVGRGDGWWFVVGGWWLVGFGRFWSFASFFVSFSFSLPSSFASLLSSLGRASVIVTRSLAVVVVVVVVVVVAGCVAWFSVVMLASGHVLWSYASMF